MLNNKDWKVSSISSLSSLLLLFNLATYLPCYCKISNRLKKTCWKLPSNHHRPSIHHRSSTTRLFQVQSPSLLFLLMLDHPHQLQQHLFNHHCHHPIKSDNDHQIIISFFEPLVLLLMTKGGEG